MPKSTEAQIRASTRYHQSLDNIMIRPSKEFGQIIRSAAAEEGKPVQRYILDILERELNIKKETEI